MGDVRSVSLAVYKSEILTIHRYLERSRSWAISRCRLSGVTQAFAYVAVGSRKWHNPFLGKILGRT